MDHDDAIFLIDSSVLISCGRFETTRFQALAREARRRDTVFRISPQVYAEVTNDPAQDAYISGDAPVDKAIEDGWMTVTASPSYSNPDISTVIDKSRSFIANATNRAEDRIETADTELVGLALELFSDESADRIVIVTNDIPLGEAAESLLPQYGFSDEQVNWLRGSELASELTDDFVSEFD